MKRALLISLAWYPFESGAENAPRNIIDRMHGEYEFDVITYRFKSAWPKVEKVGAATVYRISGFTKYDWMLWALLKAIVLHRQKSYDLVWSIMAAYAGGVGYWFKRLHPRVPLLLTLQEGDPVEHIIERVGLARPWFYDLFRRADAVQVISRYLADLAKQFGFSGEPVVIPNGVDLEKFQPPVSSLQFPKNLKEVVLINNSRLVYKNAHDVIIQALKYLPEQVVYKNVSQQGDLQEELLALAKDEGVAHRVFLLPGIAHEKVPEWLSRGDIFVRPSRSEGLGTSFLEAMAAGLPVIGTRVGGIPDFLSDGETGLFVEVDNPKSVARAVQRLIDNAALRTDIIRKALEIVHDRYDWQTIATAMCQLLLRLTETNLS